MASTTFIKIGTVTLDSTTANIEFTSIPQTFTDLCVLLSVRSNRSATNDSVALEVNGSTASRSGRAGFSNASAPSGVITTTEVAYAALTGNTATASTFSNITIYCPDYTSSANKSFSAEGATGNNSAAADAMFNSINGFLWAVASPITSLTFKSSTGNSFVQHSTATLYGIRKN